VTVQATDRRLAMKVAGYGYREIMEKLGIT
jgi:hypothetical protein